jgi:cell division protein FtsI (penicillin-binding protein 3)
VHVVAGVVLALLVGVAGRVVQLQTEERDFLKRQGDARTIRTVTLPASRGVIFDRRGEPLAVSTPVASVWADPSGVDPDDPRLDELARLLEREPAALRARLARFAEREFLYLRRQVDPALAERIAALGIPGVDLAEEYKRFYPAGEVAAHVVGITDVDDAGIEGLELAYDDWLSGTPGRKRVLRDRRGHLVRDLEHLAPVEPGRDLHLSLDLRLQYLAYRELKAAIGQYSAVSGTVVVLDVETGEVLAMVNQPAYNPNAPVTGHFEALRNRAVTDVYEPGSTVKPITVSAALETGRYTPETVIDTSPGWVRVAGKTIEDPLDRGPLDLGEIVAKSSQVGISQIALDLEDETLLGVMARFGLGVPTGIGFPGEGGGRLPGAHGLRLIERVTLGYGYGLAVTPLQLVQAYTVFASGGRMIPPTLVRDDEGTTPRAQTDVLAPDVAAQVATMLEAVVREEGTATRAEIPGYRVAGKTGTARKLGDAGYDDARHLAYFVGFAPVSSPRVAAVVLVNEPRVAHAGGGTVAAPVFSRVVAGALRLLNVPPDDRALARAAEADEEAAG